MPLFLISLFFLVSQSLFALPSRFDMRDAIQRNSVLAISEAPLERTITLSRFITGSIELDPENLGAGIKGQMELDTRTLEFGTELKTTQVREQFLNVAEFPVVSATFQNDSTKGKLADGQPVTVKSEADLTLKGITKKISVPLQLTYFKENESTKLRLPGNLLRVRARFDIDGSLFGISIPENLKSIFNKTIQVALEMFGSDRPPIAVPPLPEGPKTK